MRTKSVPRPRSPRFRPVRPTDGTPRSRLAESYQTGVWLALAMLARQCEDAVKGTWAPREKVASGFSVEKAAAQGQSYGVGPALRTGYRRVRRSSCRFSLNERRRRGRVNAQDDHRLSAGVLQGLLPAQRRRRHTPRERRATRRSVPPAVRPDDG
jgi:hypothetical protein